MVHVRSVVQSPSANFDASYEEPAGPHWRILKNPETGAERWSSATWGTTLRHQRAVRIELALRIDAVGGWRLRHPGTAWPRRGFRSETSQLWRNSRGTAGLRRSTRGMAQLQAQAAFGPIPSIHVGSLYAPGDGHVRFRMDFPSRLTQEIAVRAPLGPEPDVDSRNTYSCLNAIVGSAFAA